MKIIAILLALFLAGCAGPGFRSMDVSMHKATKISKATVPPPAVSSPPAATRVEAQHPATQTTPKASRWSRFKNLFKRSSH